MIVHGQKFIQLLLIRKNVGLKRNLKAEVFQMTQYNQDNFGYLFDLTRLNPTRAYQVRTRSGPNSGFKSDQVRESRVAHSFTGEWRHAYLRMIKRRQSRSRI